MAMAISNCGPGSCISDGMPVFWNDSKVYRGYPLIDIEILPDGSILGGAYGDLKMG